MEAGLWININEDEDITEDEDNYIDLDVEFGEDGKRKKKTFTL